jgi:hypothetical protein
LKVVLSIPATSLARFQYFLLHGFPGSYGQGQQLFGIYTMVSITPPDHMAPDKRLDEIASILAAGVIRLQLKQSEKSGKTESYYLDNGNQTRPHDTVHNNRLEE